MSRRKAPARRPEGLSERAAQLWDAEVSRSKSAGRRCLLEECLRHLTRADALAELVAREGLTTTTKTTGAIHVHPLVKTEQAHRNAFVKLAKMLELQWDSARDGSAAW